MIRIVVASHQGLPSASRPATSFDATGGTIGRAATNTLVLDDPDRTVSRVHAQVLCRNGQFFIVDRGSNPLLCNGRALGAGNEAALQNGDRLVMGGFELAVELLADAPLASAPARVDMAVLAATQSPAGVSDMSDMSDDDPFADLLAGLSPAPAPAAPRRPADASADAASLGLTDPMRAGAKAASAGAADPFADLLGPGSGGATGNGSPAAHGAGLLNDFSDLGLPASGNARVANIDDLFGGKDASLGLGGDPLAMSPLADPMLQPNTAGAADPFAALQRQAAPVAAPRSDHLPVGQFGYVPPQAQPARGVQVDDLTGLSIRISGPARGKPLPPIAASPMPSALTMPAEDDPFADLLAAFLRGLGSQHQPPEALTPALMERVGSMLRASTEGTLQLLLTRQEFKREVRAEVTMIASQANNPLKFSPTVEVALAHLLGPGVRGFMPAEAAMRDAYDDLRSHQFGVMVGMRAALAHVISRFEPGELEAKIVAKSTFDSLFSTGRKARLWDQFVALYAGIATEAEDDFHNLFGKAFVAAYEEQMARLQSSESSGPAGH